MVTAPQLYFHIKNIFENNRIENPQFEAMCVVEHIFRKKPVSYTHLNIWHIGKIDI